MTMTPDVLTAGPERELLAELAAAVPEGQCAVELGVFRGGSLQVIARAARVPVYGVDTFGGPGTPAYYRQGSDWIRWWERFAQSEHSWAENLEAAHDAAPTAHLIVGDTAEAGRDWDGPPVGLLYIDADHSFEGVSADYWSWLPRLAPGAAVVFDDYAYQVRGRDHYPDVTRFVDSLGLPVVSVGKAAVVRP